MRFKALPELAQVAMSRALVDFFKTAPAELAVPVQPAPRWLAALRELNVKLGGDGMPTSSAMADVVEHVRLKFGCGH